MSELIARCPEHGLHGDRAECFVCGGPVEQVEMVPVAAVRDLLRDRDAADPVGTLREIGNLVGFYVGSAEHV